MITKEQALELRYRDIVHFHTACKRLPNGKVQSYKARVNGQIKVWKTRKEEFRLPVIHGLYDHGAITHLNCSEFSLEGECPICNGKEYRITHLNTAEEYTIRAKDDHTALEQVAKQVCPDQEFIYRNFSVENRTYSQFTNAVHTFSIRLS